MLNLGSRFAPVGEGERTDAESLEGRVADLMPEVLEDLRSLVCIPSIAFPGTRRRRCSRWPNGRRLLPVEAGSGGTIPLLRTLQSVSPRAEFILWGAEDVARSRIHSSDESVDPGEIERMILAQALVLGELGAARA